MGRENYGSVNIPRSLKPRLREAAELIGWSEAQVAEAAIDYALTAAASPSAADSASKLIRLLASEGWGMNRELNDAPSSAPVVIVPDTDRPHPSKAVSRRTLRRAQA